MYQDVDEFVMRNLENYNKRKIASIEESTGAAARPPAAVLLVGVALLSHARRCNVDARTRPPASRERGASGEARRQEGGDASGPRREGDGCAARARTGS
jgi:hypothetical protein